MLLHEIFSLFKSIDSLILEGFKDDMYRLYPDAKDDTAFNNAIKSFNSDQKIKDALKKKISINGSIANSLKTTCPAAQDFINFIDNLSKEISAKEQERQEYKEIKKGNSNVNETDYWMIPCHTFEEAHEATFKYTGNLPRLSNDEIANEYGVKVPKPATFYKTNETPAEFLEKMKKETRFFMTPSWCITANKDHFDAYGMESAEDEKPLCYIFISKKYPNVRFCVALNKGKKKTPNRISYEDKNMEVTTVDKIYLKEVRDPWQIGGARVAEPGLEMMKLAFGSKIEKVIEDLCHESKTTEMISFSELKDGASVFYKVNNALSINCSFDSLISGHYMFKKSRFKTINCKFPVLTSGKEMFYDCTYLTSVITDFPSLEDGESMFSECNYLKNFKCSGFPKLTNANHMFENCYFLKKFEYNLPKLTDSQHMFAGCENLETFVGNLSNLRRAVFMFEHSGLKTFKSNLPKLAYGGGMFYKCKNLERFDAPLPKLKDGADMFDGCGKLEFRTALPNLINGREMFKDTQLDIEGIKIITESLKEVKELNRKRQPIIHLGMIAENEEVKRYIQIAEDKGWDVRYQSI